MVHVQALSGKHWGRSETGASISSGCHGKKGTGSGRTLLNIGTITNRRCLSPFFHSPSGCHEDIPKESAKQAGRRNSTHPLASGLWFFMMVDIEDVPQQPVEKWGLAPAAP
jgi:hypothetical protein